MLSILPDTLCAGFLRFKSGTALHRQLEFSRRFPFVGVTRRLSIWGKSSILMISIRKI